MEAEKNRIVACSEAIEMAEATREGYLDLASQYPNDRDRYVRAALDCEERIEWYHAKRDEAIRELARHVMREIEHAA